MIRRSLLLTLILLIYYPLYAQEAIRVACVGNSVTYGTGITDRANDSYPSQLQEMLGNQYIVGNFGKPGATLLSKGHRPYIKQDEYRDALNFRGDIIIIHLGLNDTDPRNWPNYKDEFVQDYLNLIKTFRERSPNAHIFICLMTPIGDRHPRFLSGTHEWHREIQNAIRIVAKVSSCELIDLFTPLYPYPNLFPDALHPNPKGANILAKTIYQAITGKHGGLQLSDLYSDYMMFQRGVPISLVGQADAKEKVTATIGGHIGEAYTDKNGKWTIELDTLPPGTDYTLTISSNSDQRVFHHVAVGEIWLCSGQSNMGFKVSQATDKLPVPVEDSGLRLFNMRPIADPSNQKWSNSIIDSIAMLHYYQPTQWAIATNHSVSNFSAVAYHFGKALRDSLQVPIGLICNAIGGAPMCSWISREALEQDFPLILREWLHNDFIQRWVRDRAATNLGTDRSPTARHPYAPAYLFDTGISPLLQHPIKGVIWYQGESNTHNTSAYTHLMSLMVKTWRDNWKQPLMPFYYVQLSSMDRPSWPWFREAQRQLMTKISHTGMVVSSDYGSRHDVHPPIKSPIGRRLALWALAQTYRHDVVPSGPLVLSAKQEGDQAVVSFQYNKGLRPSTGTVIKGFEIAEIDGLFFSAQAIVKDDTIILSSPHVKAPQWVRYGWQPYTNANLINQYQLPASTFKIKISK